MSKKSKDPAFLFYPDHFSSGTQFFTDEQVGKYIRLLCAQHQQGHLKEKHMMHICKSYDEDIWLKFAKDSDGLFYNERLELEMEKRKKYSESRSDNRNSTKNQTIKPNKKKIISKTHDNHMSPHMVNIDINVNKDIIIDKYVKKKAEKRNLNFGTLQESFSEKWDQWIRFKKEQHKQTFKSQESEQVAINHLIKISGGDFMIAEQIIEQSIGQLWKGLFELKQENQKNGKSNTVTSGKKIGRIPEDNVNEFLNRGRIAPFTGEGSY